MLLIQACAVTWQKERALRREIAVVHKRLYELGFSVANDGNTSVRLDRKRILITPSGLNKARLGPRQMVRIDLEGRRLGGAYAPSTEYPVHTMIYKSRPDVQAIVHAHPPFCIACSIANVSLDEYILPEVILTIGKIPTARYATTGTEEAANVMAELIKSHDAIIMDRHGTVTVGGSLEDALLKLERIEHTAKIVAIAKTLGNVTPLPKPEIDRLLQMSGKSVS